jgi:hypothetical protein
LIITWFNRFFFVGAFGKRCTRPESPGNIFDVQGVTLSQAAERVNLVLEVEAVGRVHQTGEADNGVAVVLEKTMTRGVCKHCITVVNSQGKISSR